MSDLNLKKYELEVNDILSKILSNDIRKDSIIKASMVYSLLDGGKRVRPMLFMLILEAHGIDYRKYDKVIAAIEMIHTYSLVHDDLPAIDNDDFRRNKPTTHVRFGEANAILCGDALLTDAFYILSTLDIDSTRLVKLIRTISLAAGSSGMIYGQALDIEQNIQNIGDLETIYYYKTAQLMQASLAMAAIIADQELDDYIMLGSYLGQAFQIQDDILEHTQSSEKIGKSNSSDSDNEKNTIVTFIGLPQAQLLAETYFDEIENLLEKLNLTGTKFHLLILEIANREK